MGKIEPSLNSGSSALFKEVFKHSQCLTQPTVGGKLAWRLCRPPANLPDLLCAAKSI